MKNYIKHYIFQSLYDIFDVTFNIKINALAKPLNDKKLFVSAVKLKDDEGEVLIHIGLSKNTLDEIATIFFGTQDDYSDDDELKDLLKEVSNMIVGKVKVLISDASMNATVGIPELIEEIDYDSFKVKKYFKANANHIMIAY